MKNVISNFHENHPGSLIIHNTVNDPLRVWKENQSITIFRCYFRIKKGHNYTLLVEDGNNEEKLRKTFERILCNTFYGEATTITHKI